MDLVDIQAMESKLNDVTVTAIPMTNLPHGLKITHSTHPQTKSHFHQPNQSVTIQTATNLQIQQLQNKKQLQQQQQAAANLTRISADITTPLSSLPAGTSFSYNGSSQNNQAANANGLSKYAQLLSVIEEMGRDIRPTYANGRSSGERLKRSIIHAKVSEFDVITAYFKRGERRCAAHECSKINIRL